MADFRVYCSPAEEHPSELRLSPEESHHLVAVNRARMGDPVVAFDGRGTEWMCAVSSASKSSAVLEVNSTRRAVPLGYEITLAQALPKGPAMDAIVRKATEIGAARIVPMESDRTQVHLESGRQDKKLEKWQTAALEAAKQCGNPWLPEIRPVQSAAELINSPEAFDLKLVASLHSGAKSLRTVLNSFRSASGSQPKRVLWMIGPEGDFSPAELELAGARGFEPVTLGPLVLRCETAAVYALSVLSYELTPEAVTHP